MAQQFTTESGQTLIIPGTYVDTSVQPGQGAVSLAGVVTIFGESDAGPHWSKESELSQNAFSPDQYGDVLAKYGSGRLVEAFKAATAPNVNLGGAVSLVRIVKTNNSLAAEASFSRAGFGNYGKLTAKLEGANGNLIKFKSVADKAEIAPTTGSFTYCPVSSGSVSFGIRVNGAVASSVLVSAKESPALLRLSMESVAAGILVKGALQKEIIPASGLTLSAAAPSADKLVVTLQSGNQFAQAPAVGDTVVIPANADYSAAQDSAIAGGSQQNAGSYIVTDIVNTLASAVITLKRISSGSCVAASGTTAADKTDMIAWSPMEIKNISGMDRGSLVGVDGSYSIISNNGTQAVINLPSGKQFAAQPKAGDTVLVPANFSTVLAGFYSCISATASSITIQRVSEGSSGTGAGSQVVSPAPTLATQPISILKKEIDGLGKSLAIEGSVEAIFRDSLSTAGAALSNQIKTSAQEYKDSTTISRAAVSGTFKSGGDIVIQVGCSQEDATMEIVSDRIDFKVNGVLKFSCSFEQFKTLSDLAAFINSQTSFSASVSAAKFSSVKPADLDKQIAKISSSISAKPGRIKKDAKDWLDQNSASGLAMPANIQSDASGLPEAMASEAFLAGGAKGGTTSADAVAAIDAIEKLDTNFIVPLFSKDAADDIASGETASSSTYSIDAINAYLKSHVINMSAMESRKNRIAVVSKNTSYEDAKEQAGQMSSFRIGMAFQDVKMSSADGTIKQFQSWMGAVIAASMQAAAGFKGIVKKFANVSGVIKSDFDASSPGELKDALKAGLLVLEKVPTGGFRWVSDQMTYSVDNNFVYNSMQAVYLADLMALVLIDRFDRLIVGQSVAEISSAAALGLLEAEMFNFLRLKWITPSDDAPKGFKNPSIKLRGGVMQISVEIKLAGLIYFVPIKLTISEVQQTS